VDTHQVRISVKPGNARISKATLVGAARIACSPNVHRLATIGSPTLRMISGR
jgi:hypothetical protein